MATTIQIEPETREKLRMIGEKGETYNDIILRLISLYEARMAELERRLSDPREEFVAYEELKKRMKAFRERLGVR
ncbi:MAG: hypothetical protein J7J17_01570 [Hadesarchaea archaeon]|nr:hypothetical protein [Hadesarchaea archaeon]